MKTNYLITTTVAAPNAGLAFFQPAGAQTEEKKKVLLGRRSPSISWTIPKSAITSPIAGRPARPVARPVRSIARTADAASTADTIAAG